MDVAKLLQAVEEIIFEVACLAVLLPKTFFFLAFSPRKAYAYVIDELQKKPQDRFDRFASPLILWSATGILPHFVILNVFAGNPALRELLAANTDDIVLKLLALPAETRFVALTAFAVSLPLAFAVVIARERKQETAKSSLREPLYSLCYCTAPVFLAATPVWVAWAAQLRGLYPEVWSMSFPGTSLYSGSGPPGSARRCCGCTWESTGRGPSCFSSRPISSSSV